jgi:Transmembrane secretion effector
MPDSPGRSATSLRHRDFALLWSGQAVSLAGNGVFTVALPLEVLRLGGSSVDLALVISARTIPMVLLMLAGGTVVDRVSRRMVMLVSDAGCGILVAAAAVLIALGRMSIWELALLGVGFGIASAFFKPASSAIVPDILPSDALMSASSMSTLSQSLTQYLLGPLAGGLIVAAVGSAWAFGIDAASFVVSAACLTAMHRTRRPPASGTRWLEGLREGIGYCRSQAWLWWSMIAVGVTNFVCVSPLTVLQPLLVTRLFHGGSVALGLMYCSSGIGGAIASLCASRWPPRRRVMVIWVAWASAGAGVVGLGLSPTLWMAVVFAGATWFCTTYGNVVWFPLMQQEIPHDMLGRASSVDWALSLALAPLGTVSAGALALLVGVRPTLIIGGAIGAAVGMVLLVPGVTAPDRRVGQLTDASPREPAPSGET